MFSAANQLVQGPKSFCFSQLFGITDLKTDTAVFKLKKTKTRTFCLLTIENPDRMPSYAESDLGMS